MADTTGRDDARTAVMTGRDDARTAGTADVRPLTVRYFAAAADAAGTAVETVSLPTDVDLAGLCAVLVDRHGAPLGRVLDSCAFLLGDDLVRDRGRSLSGESSVEVLPPFAGG